MLVVSDEVLLKSAIERLDVLINEVCRSIYDLTDTYYTISIVKDNELWSKACELSYEDNEHLRRTLLYKQDLLKVYEERLAQIEL